MPDCFFAGQCSCPCAGCDPLPFQRTSHCHHHGSGCHASCTPPAAGKPARVGLVHTD